MRAVLMERFAGPLVVTELPDPTPPEDGVVIEVKANGVCRSDWHAWMGHDPTVPLPHVPGHELAGVVAAVGPLVRRWQRGDRVSVPFCCGCGVCPECRSGNHQVCPTQFQPGFSAWGSFAQQVAIPFADANLVRLPDNLGYTAAAALGCRFMTSFRGVVDQGRVRAGDWVAVHGCGGVGLSAVMIAAALGARVAAVDIDAERLALARRLGATVTVLVTPEQDPVPALLDLTGGGAQVSIEALGHPVTCANSVRCLARRGRHIQIGLTLGEHSQVSLPMDLVIGRELEILGSHGMPAHRFGAMLGMITAERLDPGRLIGKTITLDEAPAELEAMGRFAQQGVTVIDRF